MFFFMEYIHLLRINKKNKSNDYAYNFKNNISFLNNYLILILVLIMNYFISIKIIYSFKNFQVRKNQNINDILRKCNEYIIISKNRKMINRIPYTHQNQKTKISAIIITYNSEKLISKALSSVQNQRMTDIEILIIDDNSLDNSFKIIEKYRYNDKRIKIIRNKKNKGALYSRSIGVFNSKSKYVIHLDSDDLFINDNLFNLCYEEVKNNNLDILEFSGFHIKKPILRLNNILPKIPLYLRYKTNNLTLKQPQLFDFLFQKKGSKIIRRNDGFLWGKCIKTNTYIQALNILGKKIYSQFHNYGEDRIVNFVLFKYANSFKFIEEYGIAYLYNPFSICNSQVKELITHDELINIMSIYNFTKNSTNLNIVVYELKHRWKNIIKPGLNEYNINITKYIINSLIESKYLNNYNKKKLKEYLEEI